MKNTLLISKLQNNPTGWVPINLDKLDTKQLDTKQPVTLN